MRWKLLDRGPPATYAVVLAHGDEAIGALQQFVREQKIDAASLTAGSVRVTRVPLPTSLAISALPP